MYDNFLTKGYTCTDTDVVLGPDDRTIRNVVRDRIHLSHQDRVKFPVGAKLYRELKAERPPQDTLSSALPPQGDQVVRHDLDVAFKKNAGPCMRHRELISTELQILTDPNVAELNAVCLYLRRLNPKNDGMRLDAMTVVQFLARHAAVAAEHLPLVRNQVDEVLLEAPPCLHPFPTACLFVCVCLFACLRVCLFVCLFG